MSNSPSTPLRREEIRLPDPQPWPAVACTAEELERLRAAYRSGGPERDVVARKVERAEQALEEEVRFPPEGGQHNQWYQCSRCQLSLETVHETHHRCPKCAEIYSGYPYDNVIFSRRHSALTRDVEACAWAFALTGEERYAQRTRDILVGYTERYASYPYHSANMGKRTDEPNRSGGHVFEQTLNEASWMREVCESYDLVRLAKVFSKEDHRAIREDFLLKVYENIDKHRAGKSNWQTYHNSALMLIGGLLDEEELVRQAIADEENGFFYQMEISVLPGGMWYENSWSYHFYTLGAVERIVETARRLGIDLYNLPQVKEMYSVALDYRMADGTLPRFGDATTTGIPGGRYEPAYHRWRDPEFLALLPAGPTWESILYGRTEIPGTARPAPQSALKPGAGHAILQADGAEGRSSAVLTFGPFGGFHGHFDKLSFVYFALGRELGYDPGRARSQAYRLPVHGNWYRATTSHNALLVDRASQEGVEGDCELFVDERQLAAAAARVDDAYPGIVHQRLLVLRPGFLVVADALEAEDGQEHIFDWLYHNRGEKVTSSAAHKEGTAPEGQGFEYVEDARLGSSDEAVRATFSCGDDRVEVTVNGAAQSEVMVGTGVGESVLDRVPLLCVTRRGVRALFAAAIDPTPAGQPKEVESVEIQDYDSGGYLIRVLLRGGVEEVYAYDPDGASRLVEGIETHSRLLCLQRKDGACELLAEAGP